MTQSLQRASSIETLDELVHPDPSLDRRAIIVSMGSSHRLALSADSDIQEAFVDGLVVFESPPAPPEQPTSFMYRTLSLIPSRVSADTFLTRDPYLDPTITLLKLLDTIGRHRSLQYARIVEASSYQPINRGVKHRFIILELEREERQRIWLRIDRRIQKTGPLSAVRSVGGGPKSLADDRVSCSITLRLCSTAEEFAGMVFSRPRHAF